MATCLALIFSSGFARAGGPAFKVLAFYSTDVEPDHVKTSTGLLVISGGSNDSKPSSRLNPLLAALAAATGSVISELAAGQSGV